MKLSTRRLPLLSLALVLAVGALGGWPPGRWRAWERSIEQQLVLWRGPRQPPAAVVVVAIDDATLQQGGWFVSQNRATIPPWARGIGTLPWPRTAYGLLAERLLEAGAAGVAINVVFAGPSSQGTSDDRAMNRLLEKQRGRVALAAEMLEPQDPEAGSGLTLVRPEAFMAAIGGPAQLGLTNVLPQQEGAPAFHPEAYGRGLLPANGVEPFPSLAGTALRLLGRPSLQPDQHRALNVYGPEGTFLRLSAWEVLDPERWRRHPRRAAVQGALVLVGPVVSQGEGGNATPFGNLSGLELLATATANSLQGDGLAPWPEAPLARALLAALPVLLVALAALRVAALRWRLLALGVVLVVQLTAGAVLLARAHRWLPLLAPVSGLVLLGLLYGGDAYLREERERRRLRRTFERYVAPSVVAEILADPAAADGMLRGRLRPVTVLFSDLKGFTQLTRLRSSNGEIELHVQQLNRYLGAMVEVITAHGGTIDKFIGDAVMAVFGAPLSRGQQAEALAALRCATAMKAALAQLNARWAEEGLPPFASGIGLASGAVIVGQIGSPQRLEFTVIGDTVNLASRLEGLTRQVDAGLLFDQATADLVAEVLPVQGLGERPVKGMEALPIYTLGPAVRPAEVGG
ncbi:adenylate/guanylate cyclase domain-containing protein [Synechococcus sp. Lug-A]|uniref:adenylate/guanylate cyclase domain-containing protein n=1 Tax=Synechococcus sp. Lug-A TaxID=2823740 RepID=UPI0020CBFF94|nr:adenylate/guanylate cyclase domain-containing protein [Synechococcus sp. Lug-A]MCP9848064.1 adenylate/guanylate cyclase domain-containing protein [Synechococcus sp. Lug-A]